MATTSDRSRSRPASANRFVIRGKLVALRQTQRELGKAQRAWHGRLPAAPDVGADVVMVAVAPEEQRAGVAPLRHREPEGLAVEVLGMPEVGDRQVDVADARRRRKQRSFLVVIVCARTR